MAMRFGSRLILWAVWMVAVAFAVGLASMVWAEAVKPEPVGISSDRRFEDFGDGTIRDRETGLIWTSKDYWQMENKWLNWYTANEYVQRMNNKKFAGYTNWRLPTVEEAASLYNRRKRNIDKDGDKIFIDPIFSKGAGWSTWTSEGKQNKALVVSYKDEGGETYQDKISGTDAFLRPVRGPSS